MFLWSVSIHATLAGGDQLTEGVGRTRGAFLSTPPSRVATEAIRVQVFFQNRFYPRHPRGWRLQSRSLISFCINVSIHATLAGGDKNLKDKIDFAIVFLSTPPSRMATIPAFKPPSSSSCFYPRHPRGWRPSSTSLLAFRIVVSIHATLAGGDCLAGTNSAVTDQFLSTPPSRVAT